MRAQVFVINRILFQKTKQASVEQALGIFYISKDACTRRFNMFFGGEINVPAVVSGQPEPAAQIDQVSPEEENPEDNETVDHVSRDARGVGFVLNTGVGGNLGGGPVTMDLNLECEVRGFLGNGFFIAVSGLVDLINNNSEFSYNRFGGSFRTGVEFPLNRRYNIYGRASAGPAIFYEEDSKLVQTMAIAEFGAGITGFVSHRIGARIELALRYMVGTPISTDVYYIHSLGAILSLALYIFN